MEAESDSDDGIIVNEVQTVSTEGMFVIKFCCEESTFCQQTAQIDSKLKAAKVYMWELKKIFSYIMYVPTYDRGDLTRLQLHDPGIRCEEL